jgi:hypothetical protein
MKKRVVALIVALDCFIGFLVFFTELTEMDSFLRHTVLRAAPSQLKECLRSWRAPLVIRSSPEQDQSDVLPRSPITLTFLTPMIPSTVERHLSFEPQMPGRFSWQDERTLVFTPAQPWPAGAKITVEVSRGARSWLLRRMEAPFTLHFTILASPMVIDTEPSQQIQFAHDLDQVTITFSHLMAEASVESRLSVEPQIHDLELTWAEETLAISGEFRPGTTYQVNIAKGAQDATYGLPMTKDFTQTWTVVERQPNLAVAGLGRVGMVEAEAPFQLPLTVLNLSRIDLALYALDGPTFIALQSLSAQDWEQYRPERNLDQISMPEGTSQPQPGISDPWLIREWSAPSEAKADQEMSQMIEVDPLPPGLYSLAVSSPEGAQTSRLLSVSRSALVFKRAPEQVLVWVVALADGSPAADYEVTIYEKDGGVLATGRTDREGVYKSPLPQETGPLLAIAQQDDDVAVCAEEWSTTTLLEDVEGISRPADTMRRPVQRMSGNQVYAYTNRSIYHSGQEVHFKAIVRHDDDGRYSLLPTDTMVPVVVTDEAGRTVYQETLQLGPFGSISGSFPLSEEAIAGRYRLGIGVGGEEHEIHFQVERPRRPGYAVSVTTDQPGYVRGDVITATVNASYDFEVPVAGAEVSYTLHAASYLPPLPGDDFRWTGPQDADGVKQPIVSGQGVTDDAGRLTIPLPTDVKSWTSSQLCTLEVMVTAPSQQPVSAFTLFPIHQSGFYIGLRPERRVARVGQEVSFNVQIVDTEGPALSNVEGQPLEQVNLRYTLDLVEWHREGDREEWEEKSTEVTRGSLHTDGQGQAQIASKPTTGGLYRLRIEGEDRQGNPTASSAQLWVSEAGRDLSTGSGRQAGWRWLEDDQLKLITDKVRYRAGEVAEVMVLSPYPRATALLTVERGRVMACRAVDLEGYSDIVSVPVEPEYFPNAFVSVVLIPDHPLDGEPPGVKTGYAELTVESAEKEMTVTLSPEKERYQPGERVVYTVRTADGEGQPLSAEVSLAVVDAASSEMLGIIEAFYGRRGLAVRTAESLAVHLGREGLTENLVSAPAGFAIRWSDGWITNPAGANREVMLLQAPSPLQWPTASPLSTPSAPPRFRAEAAYWNPAVVTGEDGQARVSFRLPDELTAWRVLAQGVTVDTRVGTAATDLLVSQDLTARLALPPFLRTGDQLVVGGLMHNHTDRPLETAVTLTTTGLELQDPLSGVPSSSKGRTVVISAGRTAWVDWPATVSQESTATFALSATGEAAADEAEQRPDGSTGPVLSLSKGSPRRLIERAVVPILPFGDEGGLTDAGGVEDEIALTVSVPKNAITTTLTIKGFPSLLALTVDSLDYLQSYPYGNTEQTASWLLAVASVRQTLGELGGEALSQKLAQQGQAALWRLYRFQGEDGGWGWWEDSGPSPYLTAQAVHSLTQAQKAGLPVDEGVLERGVSALQDDLRGAGDPNLRAYLLYVLTEAGEGSLALADSLADRQGELSPWGQVCLAMAMHALGRTDEASGLVADLAHEAAVTVGTAHWQEGKLADQAMTSEINTTALALQALLQIDPDSPLIPQTLDWLIRMQQDGHWRTPRKTAAVVVALTDYLLIKGERPPNHHYQALVNGQVVGRGISTRENMAAPVTFVVTDLLEGDNEVRLIKEGKERLHYALTLHHYRWQKSLEPARALGGPSLRREYFDPVTGDPKTEYRVGDLMGVRLTVEAPEEMWYITVEDPLPAGVEAIEGSLKAESASGSPLHFERRDEKAALFIQRLEAGEHIYRYLVRATVPGRFQAMPALVYPMYEPNLWGRSASDLLHVESLTFGPK